MSGTPAAKKRVLLVETNEDGTEGGSYRALLDLVRGLDRERYRPLVLLYQDGPTAAALRQAGVDVHVWASVRSLEHTFSGPQPMARRLRGLAAAVTRRIRFLRQERVDLLHLNNSPGVAFDDWLPAARLAGIPVVTHVRGPFQPATGAAARFLQRRFDAVVAVSAWMAEAAAAAGMPRERIRVVHDGVDAASILAAARRPPTEMRAELGLAAEDFMILLVGHLRPWKGQQVAIDALRRMSPSTRAHTRLVLVGAAPSGESGFEKRLESEVREGGLGACVRFLGERRDVPDLMRACDVVLHASTRPEPFGLVVVEAMVLGRPVVASRLGGPSEIVNEGAGLLFDPNRPDELCFLLAQLEEQPGLRERLGSAGRERARAFDVGRTVEGVERCWAELLGLAQPGGAPGRPPALPAAAGETRGTMPGTP